MTKATSIQTLGVVGTGAMGRGIAQIAALAGLTVRMYDTNANAIEVACAALAETLRKLAEKGKLTRDQAAAAVAALKPCASLSEMADCDAVVEAIVERLDVKRELFAQLEGIVRDDCILATNTSSLSVTAIAAGCRLPQRVAGYHFFNPVPLMKVVEVIDGLRTAPEHADALVELAQRMGHAPVRCKDMPGFIVNHAGRGMNTEGLRIAQEGVADFATVDAIMREQAGFRMGPFELMDLTGLDVSQPVMESIYRQFYDEPRFRPSPIAAVRQAGGLLGRKVSEGFYRYPEGQKQAVAEMPVPARSEVRVWVSRAEPLGHSRVGGLLERLGATLDPGPTPMHDSLIVVTPFGHDCTSAAMQQGLDATRTVAVDALLPFENTRRRTLMTNPATTAEMRDAAHALLASDGTPVSVLRDSSGFVAQRVIAMIVNIACDIAQQRIATPADIDRAVTLGLGYPQGPLALGDAIGADVIATVLHNMLAVSGDPRYRPSLWLARRAALGLSLRHAD